MLNRFGIKILPIQFSLLFDVLNFCPLYLLNVTLKKNWYTIQIAIWHKKNSTKSNQPSIVHKSILLTLKTFYWKGNFLNNLCIFRTQMRQHRQSMINLWESFINLDCCQRNRQQRIITNPMMFSEFNWKEKSSTCWFVNVSANCVKVDGVEESLYLWTMDEKPSFFCCLHPWMCYFEIIQRKSKVCQMFSLKLKEKLRSN